MSTNTDDTDDGTDVPGVVAVQRQAEDVADRIEQGDAQPDEAADAIRDLAHLVGDLSDEVRALQDRFDRHQSGIAYAQALEAQGIAGRVSDLEEDSAQEVVEQPTTIQQFAAIPPEARDSLGPSDRRAAFLYENFSDWARQTKNGPVLSTATGNDGRAKVKQLLEQALKEHGYDRGGLAWNEVYRAMKMVARKSGGEDDSIDDGAFRFIPSWSDPWTDGNDTSKVLVLKRPELLQAEHADD
jgi:hypothetical protein